MVGADLAFTRCEARGVLQQSRRAGSYGRATGLQRRVAEQFTIRGLEEQVADEGIAKNPPARPAEALSGRPAF